MRPLRTADRSLADAPAHHRAHKRRAVTSDRPLTHVEEQLIERLRRSDPAALARVLTRIERNPDEARPLLVTLHRHARRPRHVVGVTGPPGSGKSTLVRRLAFEFAGRGHDVGVLAVDPSSPYSGGSILGDRIRMLDLAREPRIFIRSMATRGTLGGLARPVQHAVEVLAAAGKDIVIIETVGVGQDEIAVIDAADTVVVVSVPGLGDDIQTLKAGLLEIADIHVVNKADLPGADRTVADLRNMLRLSGSDLNGWSVPVRTTVAETGTGVLELMDGLIAHRNWLNHARRREARELAVVARRIRTLVVDGLLARLHDPAVNETFEALIEAVMRREQDPYWAAEQLLDQHLGGRAEHTRG